jgi:DNA-binding NtrC family response regulator
MFYRDREPGGTAAVVVGKAVGQQSSIIQGPSVREQAGFSASSILRGGEVPFIYMVDDEPLLTELYTAILEGAGYAVRAFNDRAEALSAMQFDWKKPALLIMDYLGHAMSVNRFLQRCLELHPTLRILMASGFYEADARCLCLKPNRFIQKPFTVETFLNEVSAALAA